MSDTDPARKLLETSVLLLAGKQLSGTKIIASLGFPMAARGGGGGIKSGAFGTGDTLFPFADRWTWRR